MASELTLFDVEKCQGEHCIRGTLKSNLDITLIDSKGELCRAKTGENFQFSYVKEPCYENIFDATKIISKECKIGNYKFGATSKALKLKLVPVEISKNTKMNEKLDKLVRKSKAFKAYLRFNSYTPPYTDKDAALSKIHKINFNKFDSYLISYKLPSSFGVAALVIKDKVIELKSQGVILGNEIFAFEINDTLYIELDAICGACDWWSGSEIFKIDEKESKKVLINYEYTPQC